MSMEFFLNCTDLTGLTGSEIDLQKKTFLFAFLHVCTPHFAKVP